MAIGSTNGLARFVGSVRRAALMREPSLWPDGRLLDAFLTRGDEAAFALLVKRHGPMVLGVCTRVIGNVHDAEDAFQAVFLVLARKARAIVPRDLVGNWLYGVAYRTALQARGRLARQRARERQVTNMPHPTVAPDVDLDALHQALDGELEQLPEKYRVPVVLCDLEGRARKEVAGLLKIPEGTLSSRLAKGRELLSGRLARHGVMLSAAALASVLTNQASAVAPALAGNAVNAALLTAAGQMANVSANVLALSEGVVKTMFLSKLKVFSILAVGILLGLGAGLMGMPATLTAPIHAAAFVDGHHLAEPDPVDGHLLLDERVQKELKLSTKQIGRIKEVSQGVDVKNEAKKKQIEELRKQIEELRVRMGELAGDVNTASMQIEDERSVTLGKAALDIVSEKAVTRLRQIQRQKRSLDNVLADAKVQRMLKVDDEQVKKIETILKTESMRRNVRISSDGMFWEVHALHWSGRTAQWDERALQKLFDILTPAQQRTMTEWLGEPHEGTSWHALRTKAK